MSSRICVKNLPTYVTEERLKDFFSQKGEVTDAKIMRTKDGNSRQFAFVGFRSENEAIQSLKYFNNSFLDTRRISCEIARKVGDPTIPRPWSRHSLNKHKNNNKNNTTPSSELVSAPTKGPKKKNTKNINDDDDDPQLQEFLQLMEPRSKSKLWDNDTLAPPSLAQTPPTNHWPATDKDLKGFKKKGNGSIDKQDVNESVVHDGVLSDMDYFKSRVRKEWEDSEISDVSDDGDDDSSDDSADGGDDVSDAGVDDDSKDKSRHKACNSPDVVDTPEPSVSVGKFDDGEDENIDLPPSSPKKEQVLQSSRLFIRNLPYTATEEELEELFSKFGSISQVHIVVDRDTKRSKGFAYVNFALPESASRALEEMDNSSFQGRLLHVMPAVSKNLPDKQENYKLGEQSKTFKQKRDVERKESEASGNTRAWNSLFMRPDTVIENISRNFGVSKTDLLDKESSDLAVRIALGETQVIADTKKALSSAGVNVSSLEEFAAGKTDGLKRSKHVILVKNLPYGSSESELVDMFGKFGSLEKVILPRTKTLALVIFLEPADAHKAFKGLAYKRFKDAPLYLEWAPGNILSQAPTTGDNNTDMGEIDAKRVSLEQQVEQITEADIDPDRIESRSLYVKNLNFKTSDEAVKEHFLEHMKGKGGKLLSVRVKKHLKNGKNVSMGFGFVEFDSVDTAVRVCKEFQETVLDGHALILQLCHAKRDDDTLPKKTDSDRSSTKLIIRNVAFQATEKDLRQLFSPFGQIKSLRLPTKVGNHRGFAFVEYVTKQEARNALQALSNSHLYGRHLVLERAKEGESLEELRARTAAQFTDSSNNISRKRKHMTVLDEGNIKFKRIAE